MTEFSPVNLQRATLRPFAKIAGPQSMGSRTTATVTAENQFTEAIAARSGCFNLSVGGSGWTATVTLQRRFKNTVTWLDVEEFTEPAEKVVENLEVGVDWRIGCKTGGFSSGSIPVRLSF